MGFTKGPEIIVRNRPLEHYLLSIFSLLSQEEKKIIVKSYGSLNGKNIDMVNLLTEKILPDTFEVEFNNSIEKLKARSPGKSGFKVSKLISTLKVKKWE